MKFKWKFDELRQELITPWMDNRITVIEIAQWKEDLVFGRFDLTGPWTGWRIRGQMIIGPGGQRMPLGWLKYLHGFTDRQILEKLGNPHHI